MSNYSLCVNADVTEHVMENDTECFKNNVTENIAENYDVTETHQECNRYKLTETELSVIIILQNG